MGDYERFHGRLARLFSLSGDHTRARMHWSRARTRRSRFGADDAVCFICLGDEGDLLQKGCGCRITSDSSLAHVECAAKYHAMRPVDPTCPELVCSVCKSPYGDKIELVLAEELYQQALLMEEEDPGTRAEKRRAVAAVRLLRANTRLLDMDLARASDMVISTNTIVGNSTMSERTKIGLTARLLTLHTQLRFDGSDRLLQDFRDASVLISTIRTLAEFAETPDKPDSALWLMVTSLEGHVNYHYGLASDGHTLSTSEDLLREVLDEASAIRRPAYELNEHKLRLARTLAAARKHEEALRLLDEVHAEETTRLGSANPRTVATAAEMGRVREGMHQNVMAPRLDTGAVKRG